MKSKKLLSSLMALSIIATSSLALGTSVQAAPVKDDAKPALEQKAASMQTINKGFDFNAYKDGYDGIHVSIKGTDYATHSYKAVIYFMDNNNAMLDRFIDNGTGLTYQKVFASSSNWQKVEVSFYGDDDYLGSQVIYR